ncbi:MAG: polysaccharide pyruvyl transferase family protein [Oscillospiraceae bacterium]|nr:polysaccharide pyruvyl transferase family protein [Oscillospiraceae bacterium]
MKIKIITIHAIPNFGSVFQCYALCEHLKKQGFEDVQVIDYNPKYFQVSSLRAKLGQCLNFGSYRRRTKKFRSFIEKNIPLTHKSYCNVEELKNAGIEADVYIAGGDQLWNVYYACGQDDAYKLTWVSGKKISYGTSLGQTDFADWQIQELAEKVRDFSAIAVRESSSVPLLAQAGIQATHCVDPVFLLEPSHYETFLKPVNQPKYLLVYLVSPSKLLDDCIAYLSKKHNLKVILCSGFRKKCACDEHLKDLGPDEVLSYIKNAEIVLSSSFHATAFSMIFRKQFFTILPDEHTNERITDILAIRGLSDHVITEKSDLTTALDAQADYEALESYLPNIESAKDYLNSALNKE